jgi:proteasome alpha subunit
MQPSNMAYDRAITVFSPDGRLFQVEYAREAVKRGTTTVGVKFRDGAILIVDKRITSRLIEPDSIEKIFIIDDHIGCATSGLVADARSLIDRARLDAQINEITYNGGVRPFGTALLIAGVDQTGARLFSTDPSGALMEYKAASEGAGRTGAMAYFEEHYKENISLDEAIDLGVKALHKGTEGKLNPDAIEIGFVKKGVKFHILPSSETKTYVTKAIGGK